MSDIANPAAVAQRFVPANRESFFDAQRRNRRATWRLTALCVLSSAIMGIPLALIVTPVIYAVILICADVISFFQPLPAAFWVRADEVARFGMVAVNRVLNHQPADPQSLALGAAVMLLPGTLLSISLWLGMNALLRNAGVGGALLALQAREPNPSDLNELRLADVVQEMAIAAGLPAPRVMLIDAPGANAAAIGTSPADARIVISRRLIDDLSRDELEGALAHLVASIGNGDLRIAFRVAAIFESCGLLLAMINSPFGSESRRTLWRLIRYSLVGSSKDAGSQEAAAVAGILSRGVIMHTDDIDRLFDPAKKSFFRSILIFILFPVFMTNFAIKMSLWFFSFTVLGPSVALLWRTRQYLADASAVQLTRNPDGLASALQKMSDDAGAIPGGKWASHLFIVAPGTRENSEPAMPDPRVQQVLAQAWLASTRPAGAPAPPAPQPTAAEFRALFPQILALHRSAFLGNDQAAARVRAFNQAAAALDPSVASMLPDPAVIAAARHGDLAAIARLQEITRQFRAHQQGAAPRPSRRDSGDSSDLASISPVPLHPSLKRRLKRLDRMGAHAQIAATDRKVWIFGAVLGLILAPFLIALVVLFLLLIAILTAASLTFLVVWIAVLHKILTLIPHH